MRPHTLLGPAFTIDGDRRSPRTCCSGGRLGACALGLSTARRCAGRLPTTSVAVSHPRPPGRLAGDARDLQCLPLAPVGLLCPRTGAVSASLP